MGPLAGDELQLGSLFDLDLVAQDEPEETVDAGTPPAESNWRTLEYPLAGLGGKTVGIVIKVSYGGPKGIFNEEAFFDEISVVPRGGKEKRS